MSNIKYTKDGKKVSIVGKLNNTEFIVQEIYVADDGSEIPAGENFTTSTLLDSPIESWKEKKLRELEERYNREADHWAQKIQKQDKEKSLLHDSAKAKAEALRKFIAVSDSHHEQLQTFVDFMAGNITHLFKKSYGSPEIEEFDGTDIDSGTWGNRRSVEGIKLISIFGKSNGDLSYRLHRYSDGSGDSQEIYPHTSYESALSQAQEVCDEEARAYAELDGNSWFPMDKWLKIDGIVIPEEARKKFEANAEKQRLERIAKLQDELDKLMNPEDNKA